MRKILAGFGLLFFLSCQSLQLEEPLSAIPTVVIDQGSSASIDLRNYFASTVQSIEVSDNPDINVTLYAHNDSLVITPKPNCPRLSTISLLVNGQRQDVLLRLQQRVPHTFTYTPEYSEQQVVVMGGFNDWSRTAYPLTDTNNDGILERTIYLKPERHEYKFVVDGEELIDPENPIFISNNIGGWNSILDLSSKKENPAGLYTKKSHHSNKLIFDFLPPEDGALPALHYVYFNNTPLHNDAFDPKPDGGLVVNISQLKKGSLRLTGLDQKGRVINDNITLIRNGQPLVPTDKTDDWHFTVMYNIMTDRFLDGNLENTKKINNPALHEKANWHGGDFAGIVQKLEENYFTDLGVNALWISPIQRQPAGGWVESIPPNRMYSGYHGYWPIAAREIDPRYGTEDELKYLVDLAHSKGIRVILDFVSNHVHQEHPYFKEHREWFGDVRLPDGTLNVRNWSEETRLTTWFDTFIPSYNYPAAPEAIEQVVDDAIWWMDTYNLDGFRQDAVKHVPHVFWKKLTARIKQLHPGKEIYQIGETFGSDALIASYVNPGELSAQFNFAIYFNARNPFAENEADFRHLATVVENNALSYGPVNLMGNITSSHDQMKFMAVADGQVGWGDNGTELAFTNPPIPSTQRETYLKLANFYAFNCAIAGIPIVYYGEEIGLMGAADPDNRRPMKFGQEVHPYGLELKNKIAQLNQLRRTHASLSIGDYIPVYQRGSVWGFEKRYFDERILVVFNHSESAIEQNLRLDGNLTSATNLLDNTIMTMEEGDISISLMPYSHAIYLLEE